MAGAIFCNLSHCLAEALELRYTLVELDPRLGSSVVRAPGIFGGSEGGWV
jgi:hypothetical protein